MSTFLGRLLLMLALYAGGFVIYYSHFPESMFPGKFDIWVSVLGFFHGLSPDHSLVGSSLQLHSHQLWHVCVFAAAYCWELNIVEAMLHHKPPACVTS